MSIDELEQVKTERVVASVSSPVLHSHDDEGIVPAPPLNLEFEVPWLDTGAEAGWRTWLGVGAGTSVGIVAALVWGDPRIGVVVVGVVVFARLLHAADRLVPFSFGEGFVGYRGDPAWPRGVQEDDDVHWTWRPSGPVGAAPPARPISGR